MSNTAVEKESARSAAQTRRGAATRARLVEAAKEVFERDGFLEARITDISKQAGVSHGAYYHYFTSKEELFREVAELQEERLTAPPDDPAPDDPAGPQATPRGSASGRRTCAISSGTARRRRSWG